jgi:DNA repair exonuclease SbcCD nuclease subunit
MRRRELVDAFHSLIERAISEGAEAFIIAGDLFDSENITRGEALDITDAIARARGTTFLYLPGNHEREALLSSGARLPENLKIFGSDWTYFNVGDVTFAGRSEMPKDGFKTLLLDHGRRNIVVLHGTLLDRCDGQDGIGRQDAIEHPIDYLALGHYHSYKAERLSERTVAVYSGTPEGRGFDETGEKGFVRILVTDTGVSHGFIPSAKRRLHIVNVDVTGAESESEIEARISATLSQIPSDDLVRAVLVGVREPLVRRDTWGLSARLGRGRFFLEVKDETRLGISPDDYKNDVSLKGEFIRLALSDESLTDEERDEVIELGLKALMGEKL